MSSLHGYIFTFSLSVCFYSRPPHASALFYSPPFFFVVFGCDPWWPPYLTVWHFCVNSLWDTHSTSDLSVIKCFKIREEKNGREFRKNKQTAEDRSCLTLWIVTRINSSLFPLTLLPRVGLSLKGESTHFYTLKSIVWRSSIKLFCGSLWYRYQLFLTKSTFKSEHFASCMMGNVGFASLSQKNCWTISVQNYQNWYSRTRDTATLPTMQLSHWVTSLEAVCQMQNCWNCPLKELLHTKYAYLRNTYWFSCQHW